MKRTLVVSASCEPLRFVGEREVISLLHRGVVEVVSTWSGETFVPRWSSYLPSIIRLKKWHARPFKLPRFRRRIVFCRDGWRCQYCGINLERLEATIDHVVPVSRGGESNWKNCVTACKPCNRKKGNTSLEKSGMRLLKPVEYPNVTHFWDIKHNTALEWHPDWKMFISK